MSPPRPPSLPRLRIAPIPREDRPSSSPVPHVPPSPPRSAEQVATDRLDALTWDQRELVVGQRSIARRQHRGVRVLLGTARGVRAIRRAQLDEAEARGHIAADLAKALAPRDAKLVADARKGTTVKNLGATLLGTLVAVYVADPPGFVAAVRLILGG